MWQKFLGNLAGFFLRLFQLTLHRAIAGDEHRQAARAQSPGPLLYAIWHEQQLQCVLVSDEAKMATIASRSKDGDIIAQALRWFGVRPARGSSSRGGLAALLALQKFVEEGANAAITVDGPRGPRHAVKKGIIALAAKTGRPIVPAAAACTRSWRFKSWDRFEVVKPFARCVLVFGPALWVGPEDDPEALTKRVASGIEGCQHLAREILKK